MPFDPNAASFVPFFDNKQPPTAAVFVKKIALQTTEPNLPVPKGPEKVNIKAYPHRRTATPASEPGVSPRDQIDETLARASALASMERRNGGRRTSLAGTEIQRQGKDSLSVAHQEAASVPPAPATPAAKAKIRELSSSLAQKEKAVVTMGHEMSEMRDILGYQICIKSYIPRHILSQESP